jgi:hypothetical protein
MKLAKGYVTQNYKNEQLMVAVGPAAEHFHGLLRSNSTAAFLIDRLKEETTVDTLVDAMTAEYEVDAETARRDVCAVIAKLRTIGAIEE